MFNLNPRRFTSLVMASAVALTIVANFVVPSQAKPVNSDPTGKLEIYSWWSGDEAPALKALVDTFQKQYPSVQVVNATVTGGAGVAAKAVLKTRMLGGDPPDTFQVHAGQELIGTWVTAGRMLPVTDLYKSEGWMDKFPEALIDLMTYKGDIWSVPVDIHRSNVFWYLPATIKKLNVTLPKTWGEFLTTCATLKKSDPTITPLALGENWTAVQLFENVLLAQLGPDDYNNVWSGKLKWTDDKVKAAWTTFGKVLDCTNSDAASLSWQQASDLVINKKAVFNLMGDWAAGYYTTTKKLVAGTGFAWTTAPGTDGVFVMLSDAFGIPKGAKNTDALMAWLKLLGSKAGEDVFNPLKGSIAARLDSDLTKYSTYSQSAAMDFQKDKIVGSLEHGAVAPEGFTNDFSTVISVFMSERNVETASAASDALSDEYMSAP
jgi:glucose/mannose transport system substrate-binding protein